jgi:lipid-binding SYLF domain-containing protein
MPIATTRRLAILAAALAMAASLTTAAAAETGTVRLKFFKAGWFVGAQGGSGILSFRDQIHALNIGGVSAGLTFGGSMTDLVGTVRNLRSPYDINGVYTAIGAGIAVGGGARAIQMQNANGVVLVLKGEQIGLQADLDLSGMSISIK